MATNKTKVIVKSNKKEVIQAFNDAAERGFEAIGMRAVTYTHRPREQGGTPVKTGNLRNSIAWATMNAVGGGTSAGEAGKVDELTVVIGTNVEYGKNVEEGSRSYRHPAHMLRNALADGMPEYEKIMRGSLEGK